MMITPSDLGEGEKQFTTITDFTIMDYSATYNAIFDRPLLNSL